MLRSLLTRSFSANYTLEGGKGEARSRLRRQDRVDLVLLFGGVRLRRVGLLAENQLDD